MWLKRLPPSKQKDPFQGTRERRRVPLNPQALRESLTPHPVLSSDAETLAGALALFNGNIAKEEIGLILAATLVPDHSVPLNASLVQHKPGLHNAGAYNVDTCCSSFLTMLEVAAGLVMAGIKKKVLLVASALDSHITDKSTDYSVSTGDAAVAGVVSAVADGLGYLGSHSTSHGNRHAAIVFQKRRPELARHTSHGPTYEQEFVTFYDHALCKEIAVNAPADMLEVARGATAKAGRTLPEVDFLVTHQPVAWREALGFAPEKTYASFEKYGNIACWSAPINFLEALEQGHLAANNTVLIASSGVGENHIAVLERLSPTLIENMRHAAQ